jgi:hypothetical protein
MGCHAADLLLEDRSIFVVEERAGFSLARIPVCRASIASRRWSLRAWRSSSDVTSKRRMGLQARDEFGDDFRGGLRLVGERDALSGP